VIDLPMLQCENQCWQNPISASSFVRRRIPPKDERDLAECPLFEQALQNDGIMLVKYWLSVSDDEQERRFEKRLSDPRMRFAVTTSASATRPAAGRSRGRTWRRSSGTRQTVSPTPDELSSYISVCGTRSIVGSRPPPTITEANSLTGPEPSRTTLVSVTIPRGPKAARTVSAT